MIIEHRFGDSHDHRVGEVLAELRHPHEIAYRVLWAREAACAAKPVVGLFVGGVLRRSLANLLSHGADNLGWDHVVQHAEAADEQRRQVQPLPPASDPEWRMAHPLRRMDSTQPATTASSG